MKHLWAAARLDLSESLRARWFQIYSFIFVGLIVLLFASGLASSRVLGFTGLSRILMIYVQLTMAILPIFVLISTVRSIAGDRDAGVFEYLLSLPVPLSSWYWGRLAGRFIALFSPLLISMCGAVIWTLFQKEQIEWDHFIYCGGLVVSLAACFMGIGFFLSVVSKSADVAQGLSFFVWLSLILFVDVILLGILSRGEARADVIIGIALLNPLQVFRTASIMIFDHNLMLLGPSAYVIFDLFGHLGFLAYALLYPGLIGLLAAYAGFRAFKKRDLV